MELGPLIQWIVGNLPQVEALGSAAIHELSDALRDSGIQHDRDQLLKNFQEAVALEQRNRDIAAGKIIP